MNKSYYQIIYSALYNFKVAYSEKPLTTKALWIFYLRKQNILTYKETLFTFNTTIYQTLAYHNYINPNLIRAYIIKKDFLKTYDLIINNPNYIKDLKLNIDNQLENDYIS